jgi:hypothetical protein
VIVAVPVARGVMTTDRVGVVEPALKDTVVLETVIFVVSLTVRVTLTAVAGAVARLML